MRISDWSSDVCSSDLVLAIFVFWQSRNRKEPLVPLRLFRDRNFSVSNVAISTMSFAITAIGFPFMLYAQLVLGMSPTEAALLLVPMAIMSIVLAPPVGKLIDRVHPRNITTLGRSEARRGGQERVGVDLGGRRTIQ